MTKSVRMPLTRTPKKPSLLGQMTRSNLTSTERRSAARPLEWRRYVHRKAMWRLAWLLVFALHLPATIKVYGSAAAAGEPTAWSSLILLAVTNLFFILEITFAWSLRILSDRRCLVAFVLIVALMHAGVLDRVMPDAIADQGVNLMLFVSTVAPLAICLSLIEAVRRRIVDFDDSSDFGRFLARLRLRYHCATFAAVRIPRYSPFRSACAHRAPPLP